MQIIEDLLSTNLLLLFTFGSDLGIWSRLSKQMADKTLTVLEIGSLQNEVNHYKLYMAYIGKSVLFS